MSATTAPRSPWRWLRDSIDEPRVTTLLTLLGYATLSVMAAAIFTSPGPRLPETVTACALTILGGVVAVPAAWVGAWWAEGPGAAAQVSGLIILVTIDSVHEISAEHWNSWPALLVAAFTCVLAGRIARIWGHLYAPGKGPTTPASLARVRAEVQVARAVDAMDAAERREG
ncbi:hypothetical protein [Actinomyces radicidentis]|uniref:hypothetical protein n=1 Tax=Actinomyces radicidentis TaxID=111015 RepID=UPI0028EB1CF8|nr:hypothetical protein [Actinomyces radicidentis]